MKKLFVVGDSTIAEFHDPYLYPRYGYGTMLHHYFKNLEIINLALSGRSSKSFIKEKNYQRLIEEIGCGDFLLIGFGHNDEKEEDQLRFTDARLPKSNSNSFSYYLEQYYLKPAREVGAIPILCTPICRLDSQEEYTKETVHNTFYGNYKDAILRLGKETNTLVLNLTDLTRDKFKSLGFAKALSYFAIIAGTKDENGKIKPNLATVDKTHLNILGAKYVAYLIASSISNTSHPLKNFLIKELIEPSFIELTFNPEYKIREYMPPKLLEYQPLNHFKTTTRGWYGTAFGGSIGDLTSSGFIAMEDENNHFIVGQTGVQFYGQLSLISDGFAYCFKQIPINKNFMISARAKVLKMEKTKQTGFGIMLRDDAYVDQKSASEMITSNYIATGLITTDTSMNPIFYKENVTLHKEEPLLEFLYQEKEEAFLKITRIGQSIECCLEYKNTSYKKIYVDFDLLQVDQEYMYVGFFATKGTVVEFYDVHFEILGNSKGA